MPFLSIIIPIFNAEEYLETCIKSILDQKYRDYEIVLVDDGSEDNSGNLCDKYCEMDPRVKVIHQSNKGLVNARRQGLLVASGKYVTFIDADDYLVDDILGKIYDIYLEYNPEIVVFDYFTLEEQKLKKHVQKLDGGYFYGESLNEFLSKVLYCGEYFHFGLNPIMWNKWVKKDLFLKSMEVPDEIRIGEDAAYMYPMIFSSNSIYYAKNVYGYVYRIQHNSMTQVDKHRRADEYAILLDYLYHKLSGRNARGQLVYYGAWMLSSYIGRERRLLLCGKLSLSLFVHSLFVLRRCNFSHYFKKEYKALDLAESIDRVLLDYIYKNVVIAEIELLMFKIYKKWR